ncbi:MAG TPA: PDZ domain-containing protein [Streptosporangiaceae bacterium]
MEVSGDRAFAHDFFSRYIQGHDAADYGRLLARAGFTVRKRNAGRAWWGDLRFESRNGGAYVMTLAQPGTPAYAAGLEQDDQLQQIDGGKIASADEVAPILQRHKPGDRIEVVFAERSGAAKIASITLAEDPHQEVVLVESSGGTLTPAQQTFRAAWLGPKP